MRNLCDTHTVCSPPKHNYVRHNKKQLTISATQVQGYRNYIYKVLTDNNLGVRNILQSACAVINIPHKYSVLVTDKYNILYILLGNITHVYTYIQSATRYRRVRNRNAYLVLL